MKPLLLQEPKHYSSFLLDPEAVARLLHEIIDLADQSGGEVSAHEVEKAARDLGYKGTTSGLRRVLLHRGFLSEVEKYKRFYLQEMNRDVMRSFFSKHETLFAPKRMDAADRALVFERSCTGGSKAEVLLFGVMRHTTFLLEELRYLDRLESESMTRLALCEASYFLAIEHVKWHQEKLSDILQKRHDTFNNPNHDIGARQQRHLLHLQYVEVQKSLSRAMQYRYEQFRELREAARDRRRVLLLKSVRETIGKFGEIFLQDEGKL